ncbi:MAG: NAD(P)-dependent glycerol-3-phosphate dehydrogenase [Clostridia bacterium]|nr:NAD(P)-dependent glycerol-3-phosphate dehydrogenase [Clostridia bacterium]
MSKVTVLGSGGWGLALALAAHYKKHDVTVWTPFSKEAEVLCRDREHKKLLPGTIIPDSISITTDLQQANGSDMVILAVPSIAVRETAGRLKEVDCKIIVNVAKGIEEGTNLRLSEVLAQELPDRKIVVLSGPSHAEEVARRIPTTVAVAGLDADTVRYVQEQMNNPFLRIYTNDDLIGVELGGALKNVIAVAAGFLDGVGLGDNTKAALITRGLAEMARLGKAMGGEEKTFMGLAGLGDLVVTCTSEHSRNHRFGDLVGRGVGVKEALESVGTVEGYFATKAAHALAEKYGVSMPIISECYHVLYENGDLHTSIESLMRRDVGEEQK